MCLGSLDYFLAKGSPRLFVQSARLTVYPNPTPDPDRVAMTLIVIFTFLVIVMSWLCHSGNCDS